jgi:glyoxylase-like metal-dependent hydrolase (beta-lactamase superfamily II)
MTLGGTNTYIVGQGTQRALVDTGEGVEQYSEVLGHALADAAKELGSKVVISRVLLTHWHHDHIGGVAQVRQMFPEAQVLKAPSRLLPTDSALNREALLLADGERISIDDGCTLRVVATPGHTDDHLSFVLEEEEAIFTGDCVLGAGSSVFSSYCDFMHSLALLRKLEPRVLYPGHGPVVESASAYVDQYIAHREKREAQILAALGDASAPLSIDDLVDCIYKATTPAQLLPAAALNVSHQLKKLLRDGRVRALDGSGLNVSPIVLDIEEYASSAGASMIARAAHAASLETGAAGETAHAGRCEGCEDVAVAGAEALRKVQGFKWQLVAHV